MQKGKFLKLTVTMAVFLAIAGAVLLFLVPRYLSKAPFGWNLNCELLLLAYALGAVLGDLLCGCNGGWIIPWVSNFREAERETDKEYGTDHDIAARFAGAYGSSYIGSRIIGGLFKLFFRLLTLAPMLAAVIASWPVRVIVSLVGWIKEALAAGVSAKSIGVRAGIAAGAVLLVGGALFAGIQLGKGRLTRHAQGEAATAQPISITDAEATAAPAAVTEAAPTSTVEAGPSVAAVSTATHAEQVTDSPAPTAEPEPEPDLSRLDFMPKNSDYFAAPRKLTVVAQSHMNIRSGPDKSYTQLDTLDFGDSCNAIAESGDWFLVEYRPDRYGWASGKLTIALWMFEDGLNGNLDGLYAPSELLGTPQLKTITDSITLRTGPSTSYKKLELLDIGKDFALLAREGSWCFINHSGSFGWIHEDGFRELSLLADGSYHFILRCGGDIPEVDGKYLVYVDILEEYSFTKEQLEKACAGERVTVRGFTLPEDIRHTEEEDYSIYGGEYISDEYEFCYNSETGRYNMYAAGYEGLPLCYITSSGRLYIGSGTEILDENYALYNYEYFTDAEKRRFGVQADDGGISAHFTGDAFADYVKVNCAYWDTNELELEGRLTVKNGVAATIHFWYFP